MKVLAIDPGVSATGAVLIEQVGRSQRVTRSETFVTVHEDKSFESLVRRAWAIMARIQTLVDETMPDVIVIESFGDIAPLRGAKNRFFCPFLLGVIESQLASQQRTPIYQKPEIKGHYRDYKDLWERYRHARHSTLIEGDEKLSNDHTRDAAIHALHYLGAQLVKRMGV